MDAVADRHVTTFPQAPTERAKDNKAYGRSKLTNHVDLLPNINGNNPAARRFRDLVNNYIVDMGGLKHCSEIKIGLLRRLAAATVQCEQLEARMVDGQQVDISTLCTLASTCMRLSVRLGLERREPSGPTLGTILRAGTARDQHD